MDELKNSPDGLFFLTLSDRTPAASGLTQVDRICVIESNIIITNLLKPRFCLFFISNFQAFHWLLALKKRIPAVYRSLQI